MLCEAENSAQVQPSYFYTDSDSPLDDGWDFTSTWTQHGESFPTLSALGDSYNGVVDIENPPVITLIGPNQVNVNQGNVYVDQGATAEDGIDGDITSEITVQNNVNTAVPGTYTVGYFVTDSAHLSSSMYRYVTVQAVSGANAPVPQNHAGVSGGGATTDTSRIMQLTKELNTLEAQLAALQATGNSVSAATFTRSLTVGSIGSDVIALQSYLNMHGYIIAKTGAGSPGNETAYFGKATQAALAAFQKVHGINPAAGYFGPTTRAYVNAHA